MQEKNEDGILSPPFSAAAAAAVDIVINIVKKETHTLARKMTKWQRKKRKNYNEIKN